MATQIKTVGELRRYLSPMPDDSPVFVYDEKYGAEPLWFIQVGRRVYLAPDSYAQQAEDELFS